MQMSDSQPTTGLPGLDMVLRGLVPGDNIVWQVSTVEDYRPFVEPYCRAAIEQGQRLVYFRFARHEPLVPAGPGIQVRDLHPEEGFETFISEVRQTVQETGRNAVVVFDCLSDLAVDWYSDQMLGNFFMLTCPYLFDMEAVAYFGILRGSHSPHATAPIAETTQLWLDTYRHEGRLYVHPIKVQQRYSPAMHMLYRWEQDRFEAVTESATIAQIMTGVPVLQPDLMSMRQGVWNRAVLEAAEALDPLHAERCDLSEARSSAGRLIRMALTRHQRLMGLVEKYMDPEEVLGVCKRMIGTGLVGGKSVGMLLARSILKRADPRWEHLLEPHDSFYIGSDVFYTFLVRNGIWWVRERQRDKLTYLDDAGTARQRILIGDFPEYIEAHFSQMLDYLGQSPYIVRSSSLLEDNFGNAFAGKYESVFCVNQGPRHQRQQDFISAVRTIYASAMSDKALQYRAQRNLLDHDEQMAILVQRVSGAVHGDLFYPQVAGVGLSFNPYVWDRQIDPRAGMLRIVFGLGTHAVGRTADDYTRVVALNAVDKRPQSGAEEVRQYSQRRADVLDLQANRLASYDLPTALRHSPDCRIDLIATRDREMERRAREMGAEPPFPWVITFEQLFHETEFVSDMREMLRILEDAYEYPVDVEFTANFLPDGRYKINIVQCRPLQVKGIAGEITEPPTDIGRERLVLEARSTVIGPSTVSRLDRIIYVSPVTYGRLPMGQRHEVARLVGLLAHLEQAGTRSIALLGPGRWGTSTPSLGVPVSFADINTVSVLCEIVAMRDGLVPDCSLGSHFLNDLIETDMLYLAVFPERGEDFVNLDILEGAHNRLGELLPEAARFESVVRVIDAENLPAGQAIWLNASTIKQRAVCYLGPSE